MELTSAKLAPYREHAAGDIHGREVNGLVQFGFLDEWFPIVDNGHAAGRRDGSERGLLAV